MTQLSPGLVGATAANPLTAGPVAAMRAFGGGGGHHTEMQYGNYDLNSLSPDDLALKLGTAGYGPAYDSNDKGSFERNYNQVLQTLTPEQLVQRYSKGAAGQFATAQDKVGKQAYDSAKSILGRDISGNELAQFLPVFGSGSDKEVAAGRGYLAQLAQQEANSPASLDKKYQANAGQYGGQVNSLFQSMLGRTANPDELDHFGKMLASGQTDPYELQQFMTQLPEYRNAQDTAAQQKQSAADAASRQQLGTELQGQDMDFFNKAKENVISRYASMGTQNSPSLDFALTNLMGDIQKQRSAYMAGLARQDSTNEASNTRQDYLQNKDLLRQDYTGSMNQMLDNQNYNRNLAQSNASNALNRSYDTADYQTQRNDMLSLLNQQQQQRRSSSLGGALGAGMSGAGALAPLGPWGAAAGGAAGLFGYLSQ